MRSSTRDCVVVVLWTILHLILIDIAINRLFAMPVDPTVRPSLLAEFFDYGRSLEGKLRRMIGPDDRRTHPLALVGWIPPRVEATPSRAQPPANPHELRVAVYGMSFTFRICELMAQQDASIALQLRGGPAAPLNHSYALYENTRAGREADVVVLGVLASSLPALHTLSHMTWNFESPGAYTYPRYMLRDGDLWMHEPTISSLDQLRRALSDPAMWNRFTDHLTAHDDFARRWLLERDVLDYSTIGRMLRRAMWQHHRRTMYAQCHDHQGFKNAASIVDLAQELVRRFAAKVREDGAIPIVLLLHDRGYSDHLHDALEPMLKAASIAYISTHDIAPADDPASFIPDGHFTPALEAKVAEQLLTIIYSEIQSHHQ